MELRVGAMFAEESCQFGTIYQKNNGTVSSHIISSNNLCGSVVDKMATKNFIHEEYIIVVLTS